MRTPCSSTMVRRVGLSVVFLVLPILAAPAPRQAGTPIAIVHAHIVPVGAPVISDGTLLMQDGTITAVGADVSVPGGATVIDAKGLWVYPGMFDANTTLGIAEIPLGAPGTMDVDEVGDFNPAEAAGVAVNPSSEIIGTTRANGVTTALTAPHGGVISGQGSVIDLGIGTTDQMNVRRDAALWVNFPQHHGQGDFYERYRRLLAGEPPASPEERERAYRKQVDQLRDYFSAARRYADVTDHATDRDLAMESMAPYVAGRLPVVFQVDRAEDIRAAVAFGEEMKLKYVLAGCNDAWEAVPTLAEHHVPVILGEVTAMPTSDNDPYDAPYSNAAKLAAAGVPFAIATASAVDSRNLPYNAALAEAYGLPADEALKAITLYPAQILGLQDELGSLAPGKRANVIVTNGDPLDVRTTVRYLFIDGRPTPLDNKGLRLYREYGGKP